MDANILSTQVTVAAAGAYILRLIQKWDKLPWVTAHTDGISIAFRAIIAFCSAIGISATWNGPEHALTITGLSVVTISYGLWHVFTLYAMQHGWGKLFDVGTTSKIETPVTVVDSTGTEVGTANVVKKITTGGVTN